MLLQEDCCLPGVILGPFHTFNMQYHSPNKAELLTRSFSGLRPECGDLVEIAQG